jgi:hypothetical protein
MVGQQLGGTAAAGGLAASAHEDPKQPLDLPERSGRGPAEGTVRPPLGGGCGPLRHALADPYKRLSLVLLFSLNVRSRGDVDAMAAATGLAWPAPCLCYPRVRSPDCRAGNQADRQVRTLKLVRMPLA